DALGVSHRCVRPGADRGVPVEPRPDPQRLTVRRPVADRVRRGRETVADEPVARRTLTVRDLFDQRLTDPTAKEVAAALRAAVKGTPAKQRAIALKLADGDSAQLSKRVVNEREGRYGQSGWQHSERARFALVWWTNPTGQKLVRLRCWIERVRYS